MHAARSLVQLASISRQRGGVYNGWEEPKSLRTSRLSSSKRRRYLSTENHHHNQRFRGPYGEVHIYRLHHPCHSSKPLFYETPHSTKPYVHSMTGLGVLPECGRVRSRTWPGSRCFFFDVCWHFRSRVIEPARDRSQGCWQTHIRTALAVTCTGNKRPGRPS